MLRAKRCIQPQRPRSYARLGTQIVPATDPGNDRGKVPSGKAEEGTGRIFLPVRTVSHKGKTAKSEEQTTSASASSGGPTLQHVAIGLDVSGSMDGQKGTILDDKGIEQKQHVRHFIKALPQFLPNARISCYGATGTELDMMKKNDELPPYYEMTNVTKTAEYLNSRLRFNEQMEKVASIVQKCLCGRISRSDALKAIADLKIDDVPSSKERCNELFNQIANGEYFPEGVFLHRTFVDNYVRNLQSNVTTHVLVGDGQFNSYENSDDESDENSDRDSLTHTILEHPGLFKNTCQFYLLVVPGSPNPHAIIKSITQAFFLASDNLVEVRAFAPKNAAGAAILKEDFVIADFGPDLPDGAIYLGGFAAITKDVSVEEFHEAMLHHNETLNRRTAFKKAEKIVEDGLKHPYCKEILASLCASYGMQRGEKLNPQQLKEARENPEVFEAILEQCLSEQKFYKPLAECWLNTISTDYTQAYKSYGCKFTYNVLQKYYTGFKDLLTAASGASDGVRQFLVYKRLDEAERNIPQHDNFFAARTKTGGYLAMQPNDVLERSAKPSELYNLVTSIFGSPVVVDKTEPDAPKRGAPLVGPVRQDESWDDYCKRAYKCATYFLGAILPEGPITVGGINVLIAAIRVIEDKTLHPPREIAKMFGAAFEHILKMKRPVKPYEDEDEVKETLIESLVNDANPIICFPVIARALLAGLTERPNSGIPVQIIEKLNTICSHVEAFKRINGVKEEMQSQREPAIVNRCIIYFVEHWAGHPHNSYLTTALSTDCNKKNCLMKGSKHCCLTYLDNGAKFCIKPSAKIAACTRALTDTEFEKILPFCKSVMDAHGGCGKSTETCAAKKARGDPGFYGLQDFLVRIAKVIGLSVESIKPTEFAKSDKKFTTLSAYNAVKDQLPADLCHKFIENRCKTEAKACALPPEFWGNPVATRAYVPIRSRGDQEDVTCQICYADVAESAIVQCPGGDPLHNMCKACSPSIRATVGRIEKTQYCCGICSKARDNLPDILRPFITKGNYINTGRASLVHCPCGTLFIEEGACGADEQEEQLLCTKDFEVNCINCDAKMTTNVTCGKTPDVSNWCDTCNKNTPEFNKAAIRTRCLVAEKRLQAAIIQQQPGELAMPYAVPAIRGCPKHPDTTGEKDDACFHMKCTIEGCNWCWSCGRSVAPHEKSPHSAVHVKDYNEQYGHNQPHHYDGKQYPPNRPAGIFALPLDHSEDPSMEFLGMYYDQHIGTVEECEKNVQKYTRQLDSFDAVAFKVSNVKTGTRTNKGKEEAIAQKKNAKNDKKKKNKQNIALNRK